MSNRYKHYSLYAKAAPNSIKLIILLRTFIILMQKPIKMCVQSHYNTFLKCSIYLGYEFSLNTMNLFFSKSDLTNTSLLYEVLLLN